MKLNKVKEVVKNPYRIFSVLSSRGCFNWMPDGLFLKWLYRARMGKQLDLDNPKTYTEKIQWLKLYDRRPEYSTLVDKYKVKEYVADRIGSQYIIPTLGVWDTFEEIDFEALPQSFVLKCTHDSGGVVICRNKDSLDMNKAQKIISSSLKRKYYLTGREWPYKDVKPRIIAEAYMEDSLLKELRDYKFFCFDGEAKMMFIATERQLPGEETKFDFYDMEFNHLDICNGHPNAMITPQRPANFDHMRRLAETLSVGMPHVRVDFYEVDGRIYFGELTFSHWSGLVPFEPPIWDEIMGDWIELSK